MVDLVSADGKQSRGVVRVCERSGVSASASVSVSAGLSGGVGEGETTRVTCHLRNFLGGTFRSSSTFSIPTISTTRTRPSRDTQDRDAQEKGKGNFFIFSEMVVRTPGEYALIVKLLDMAG